MSKIYNFSGGPAMLHPSVLEAVSKASKDYKDHGLSLMEMSHRSKPVMDMVSETESLTRELLNVPNNYHVLFLQGGASLQFAMVPVNLLDINMMADYTDTGAWSSKAIKEAQLYGNVNIACSSKDSVYNYIPKEIVNGTKQGFSAPDASWFKGESIDFIKKKLFNDKSNIYNVFDKNAVKPIIEEHLNGKKNYRLFIWSLLSFDNWMSLYL